MKDFSDFCEEDDIQPLEGRKIKTKEVLGIPIYLTAFQRRFDGKFRGGKYYIIQFQMEGELYVTFSESTILWSQLDKYEKELPFLARIIQIGSSYRLKGVKNDISQSKTSIVTENQRGLHSPNESKASNHGRTWKRVGMRRGDITYRKIR